MKSKLYLPSLRGAMGDWMYYVCIMKLKDIANMVSFAEIIHQNASLSELIQRKLKEGRGKEIKKYLLTNKERFFNSMIVAVYGGDPEWFELGKINSKIMEVEDVPEDVVSSIGILGFSGKEKLYALDGQHRLAGIKQAIEENKKTGDEELSVIFIAHRNTKLGIQRSRRLFTILNKTAKPVSKGEIIALDEDDTMAILTRRLIEENSLFSGDRVSYQKGNNIPQTNVTSITTIENLYDIIGVLLMEVMYKNKKSDLVFNRLADNALNDFYVKLCYFFDKLFNAVAPLKEYKGESHSVAVKKYRTQNGGCVYYRPIGLSILISVISKLTKKYTWENAIKLIAQLPYNFVDAPFKGIVWHSSRNIILTKGKSLSIKILLYMLDEEPKPIKLLADYKKALGEGFEDAKLPNKLISEN